MKICELKKKNSTSSRVCALPGKVVLLFLALSTVTMSAQLQTAMTYNIRYDDPKDPVNNWNNRRTEIVEFFEYYDPDLFGIQEGLLHQLTYLDENLPGYSRIGVGRDDGGDKGEFCAIYFKTDLFKLIWEDTFWLSDKPSKVSVGWDASMERICTMGLFENQRTGKRVLVLNAHYDHIGEKAREMSSKLILEKIEEVNTELDPVILMGDLNAIPGSKPITSLVNKLDDAAQLSEKGIYGPKGTFTGFEKGTLPENRIDYIFLKNLSVEKYRHIDDKMRNGNYLSDHLPVLVEFK